MSQADCNKVNEVVERDQTAAIVDRTKWQRYAPIHRPHQRAKVTLDTWTVNQRRSDDYKFHAGVCRDPSQTQLRLMLAYGVVVLWRDNIRFGADSALSIHLNRAQENEPPYPRRRCLTSEVFRAKDICPPKFRQWIGDDFAHDMNTRC